MLLDHGGVGPAGVAPATVWVETRCSAVELRTDKPPPGIAPSSPGYEPGASLTTLRRLGRTEEDLHPVPRERHRTCSKRGRHAGPVHRPDRRGRRRGSNPLLRGWGSRGALPLSYTETKTSEGVAPSPSGLQPKDPAPGRGRGRTAGDLHSNPRGRDARFSRAARRAGPVHRPIGFEDAHDGTCTRDLCRDRTALF